MYWRTQLVAVLFSDAHALSQHAQGQHERPSHARTQVAPDRRAGSQDGPGHQRPSRAGCRHGAERQQWPPGRADGHGASGIHAVHAVSQARPGACALDQPRPLRAVQRPCVRAAVLCVASERVPLYAGRPQGVPHSGLQDAGPPRGRPARELRWHRSDDWAAGPGSVVSRGLGAGRAPLGCHVQPPRLRDYQQLHLRVLRFVLSSVACWC